MTCFTQIISDCCPGGHIWQDWDTGQAFLNVFCDIDGWAPAQPCDYQDDDGYDPCWWYDYPYSSILD
ncbi:MAG: hypothetical protein HC840_05015 [Leptolyngbyaceae cyanobacterium RM2_2_4]|nr:hypothetical protein [Leptolyngbyaceae cyanobacterium RM2_2_4]